MRTITRRIRKLTDRLLPGDASPMRIWVLTKPACELALDLDRCTEILDECGFLPMGRFAVVNLCGIPDGLNADELEKFLRKRGSEERARKQSLGGLESLRIPFGPGTGNHSFCWW